MIISQFVIHYNLYIFTGELSNSGSEIPGILNDKMPKPNSYSHSMLSAIIFLVV